ncbi:PREDICTED: uncharacterized protein LOC109220673 [Nicotiana attenuata]|uniref:uncharacterized protein LOC109220673 n=1 Tax=Nicotiana attenuata TaxID=49451 RepID=UPI0009059528|nr:PREDICTED: uncharacterized protein LOC109220673 [Nicotiana attenuata]
MERNEVSSLEHNHPLFLQVADAPGLVLVPIKLTGPENYALWSRAMKRGASRTMGEMQRDCTLMDCLKKGTDSVTTYYSKMNDLWSELDVLVPLSSCDCEEARPSIEHLANQRLLQFLMGLNESYSNVRSNVLPRRPVVTVNEAYAIVTHEESQRSLGVGDANRDPLTMLAGRTQGFKPKKAGLICDHCGYKGHLKENC